MRRQLKLKPTTAKLQQRGSLPHLQLPSPLGFLPPKMQQPNKPLDSRSCRTHPQPACLLPRAGSKNTNTKVAAAVAAVPVVAAAVACCCCCCRRCCCCCRRCRCCICICGARSNRATAATASRFASCVSVSFSVLCSQLLGLCILDCAARCTLPAVGCLLGRWQVLASLPACADRCSL